MNLKDKIKLCNDLIKENEESTIKDFIEAVNEIEGIEKTRDEDRKLIEKCERIINYYKNKTV